MKERTNAPSNYHSHLRRRSARIYFCNSRYSFNYIRLITKVNITNLKKVLIFFSWMIQRDFMFELVTDKISYGVYEVVKIVLVCEEKVFVQRLKDGNRSENKINNPDRTAG